MSAQLIDGKAIAAGIRAQLAHDVSAFVGETGVVPHLAAVLLSDIDARELDLRAPRGDTRALTFPDDRAEIEALRRRRHPWLRLPPASMTAA